MSASEQLLLIMRFAWGSAMAVFASCLCGAGAAHTVLSDLSSAAIAGSALERVTARVLSELRLAPADLGRLDAEEHSEMIYAMKAADVALGDRFRLRLLSARAVRGATVKDTPRNLQDTDNGKLDSAGSLSSDTIALVLTACLGMGSFFAQARVAKAADLNQHNIEAAQTRHGTTPSPTAALRDRLELGRCIG